MEITIIGGSNIDYIGTCEHEIILKNSNVGKVRISFGGVGRNIVENLSLLGIKTNFITAIGNDSYGKQMKEELLNYGVNLIIPETNLNSSSYMALCNSNGDMVSAICDCDIIDLIDEDLLKKYGDLLKNSDYIILDGNLSNQAIDYIFKHYKKNKIIVEATSNDKAVKFQNYLDKIYLLKCNKFECNCFNFDEVKPENILITNGAESVELFAGNYMETIAISKEEEIVNTTGAGDSLLAGLIYGISKNLDLLESIKIGIEVSKITLKSNQSVNKDLKNYKF